MQTCPVIVKNRMGLARWGLLPPDAREDDPILCAKLKNVRSETVAEKRTFAFLWEKGRRCLIPASGFYEWPEIKIKGHPPFQVTAPEVDCIALAGIWTKHEDLVTFSILTCAASPALSDVHSRMPVAFVPAQAQEWFTATPEHAASMMRTATITEWRRELPTANKQAGNLSLFAT